MKESLQIARGTLGSPSRTLTRSEIDDPKRRVHDKNACVEDMVEIKLSLPPVPMHIALSIFAGAVHATKRQTHAQVTQHILFWVRFQ